MITLYRGDDSTFKGEKRLRVVINTRVSLSGCSAEFELCGLVKRIPDISTGTFYVNITGDETRNMPIGVHNAVLRAYDDEGRCKTIDDSIRIRITDRLDAAYTGDEAINVHLGATVKWRDVVDKPSINGHVLEGNMTSADLDIKGVANAELIDLPEEYTGEDLRASINAINDVLRRSMASALAILAFAATPFSLFGNNERFTTNAWGRVKNTESVVTSVNFDGLATQEYVEGLLYGYATLAHLQSNYYTSSEIDALLDGYTTTEAIEDKLSSYLTITAADETYETQAHAESNYITKDTDGTLRKDGTALSKIVLHNTDIDPDGLTLERTGYYSGKLRFHDSAYFQGDSINGDTLMLGSLGSTFSLNNGNYWIRMDTGGLAVGHGEQDASSPKGTLTVAGVKVVEADGAGMVRSDLLDLAGNVRYDENNHHLEYNNDRITDLQIESGDNGGRLVISGQGAGGHLDVDGDVRGGEILVVGGMYSPAKINLTTHSGWEGAPDPEYQINGTNLLYFANKGAAKPLPKYLHELSFDSVYPDDAAWYYEHAGEIYGSCSVRSPVPNWAGDRTIERNYDWTFDDTAEFVVRVSRDMDRFASIGIANVGANLTEEMVVSGEPSRYYKCLPGHMLDGINENGVVCEINVVDGTPQTSGWKTTGTTGTIHPLAAVRWALDNGTNAWIAATNLAEKIRFPDGWTQNFHYLVADNEHIYIVENGVAYDYTEQNENAPVVMTNFRLKPTRDTTGAGQERFDLLENANNNSITNAWFTNAYRNDTDWSSEFETSTQMELAKQYWNDGHGKESQRGETMGGETWWQTVHTAIYDVERRALKVSVQETDDWYVFTLVSSLTRADAAALINPSNSAFSSAVLAVSPNIDTNQFANALKAEIKSEIQTGDAIIKLENGKPVLYVVE